MQIHKIWPNMGLTVIISETRIYVSSNMRVTRWMTAIWTDRYLDHTSSWKWWLQNRCKYVNLFARIVSITANFVLIWCQLIDNILQIVRHGRQWQVDIPATRKLSIDKSTSKQIAHNAPANITAATTLHATTKDEYYARLDKSSCVLPFNPLTSRCHD